VGLPRTRGRLGLCRYPDVTCALPRVFDFWVIGHCTLWGCGFHADWSVLICESFVFSAYVILLDSRVLMTNCGDG